MTSAHTGAGEPVGGVWRGGLGCHWVVATSTRVCVLAEVPPGQRREAMVASRVEGGTSWRSCSTGLLVWSGQGVGDGVSSVLRARGGGRHSETRTFKTMTGSLRVMRDWLVEAGVTIAAMESTSAYWKPPFYCLEEVMEVWLLNAAHMKAVPGRKSDVRDAEWIAQLLEHGLLAPSFVPPPEIRRLRMLTRYRVQLMADRAREIVRLELMLEDASIKLSSVASSLKTVSARAILTAMINGESDPLRLADMAKGRMRRKIPDLAQALTGHFDANHARLARSMLRRLDLVEQAHGRAGRGHRRRLPAVAASNRAAANHPRCRAEGRGNNRRRDRRRHVAVPDRRASGRLGGLGAGDARVRRETDAGREAARQQMVDRDAGRGRRLGRPDARQELSRRPARPVDQTARDGPGSGRGRALHPGRGLLDAANATSPTTT